MTLYLIVLLAFLAHRDFMAAVFAKAKEGYGRSAQRRSPFIPVVALYAALPALLALPAGRMTDRLGFKIPMLFGTTGLFIALMLPFLWPSMTTLYFTACLLGLSFTVLQLATQTLAGAISGPAERARNFSLLSLGFASANFIVPTGGVDQDHTDTRGRASASCRLARPSGWRRSARAGFRMCTRDRTR